MIKKLQELIENNPQYKPKIIVLSIAVVFILVAVISTDDEGESKKKLITNSDISEDIFNVNGQKYDFNNDVISQRLQEVDNKISNTEKFSSEKIDQLSAQVAALTKLVDDATSKDKAANEINKQVQEQVAIIKKKMDSEMAVIKNDMILKAQQNLEKIESTYPSTPYKGQGVSKSNPPKNEIPRNNFYPPEVVKDSTGEIYSEITPSDIGKDSQPVEITTSVDNNNAEPQYGMDITFYGDEDDSVTIGEGTEDSKPSKEKPATQEEIVQQVLAKNTKREEDKGVYLPAGSVISGVMVSGVDMPTAKIVQKNPIPVFVRINKPALLPNSKSLDLTGCIAIVSGHGDLSTERAMLRSNVLSCIRPDNGAIEIPLSASVISSIDARVGVRGKVISKNGELIGKTILAETMVGLAGAITPSQVTTYSSTPGDQKMFQYTDPKDLAAISLGTGLSKGMSRVADYYIDLADQTKPVISVSAGSPVDLLVTTGTYIKIK